MACVNNISIDTSTCLKPCSGLIVTSFSKMKENEKLDKMLNVLENYHSYKMITMFPDGKTGEYKGIFIHYIMGIGASR